MLSATSQTILPNGRVFGSLDLTATMGKQFSGVVGEFKTSDLGSLSTDTQGIYAEIEWGDASRPDFGTIQIQPDGTINVLGQHTYQFDTGSPQATVNVEVILGVASATQVPAAQNIENVGSLLTLTVPHPDPNFNPPGITPIEFFTPPTPGVDFQIPSNGQFNGLVAETAFDLGPATYAIIDWGDGALPVFGTTLSAGSASSVAGNHDYQQPGSYLVHVTIFEDAAGPGDHVRLIADISETAT
jgi:hypothetical protein